jgi:hypothetical protein
LTAFLESNCYVDLWIEVLRSLDCDPLAMLAFTAAGSFEVDQWTFVKPSPHDLERLYGIEIQELNVWRPLLAHAREQLAHGRLVIAEVDSWFLPDTAGTDYRQKHTKTTIAMGSIEARRLDYFHNAGRHRLEGEDFDGVFAQGALPPYVEIAKLHHCRRLEAGELRSRSQELLAGYLRRTGAGNPIAAFGDRYLADVERLKTGELPDFHAFAFATVRQLGASFDLLGRYLRWLDAAPLAEPFERIAATAKSLLLKTARAVTVQKPVDLSPLLSQLSEDWAAGMSGLRARYGT